MAIDRQDSPYRRGNRYDRLPIPMVQEHCIPVDAGAVQLVVESRRLTNEIVEETYAGEVESAHPVRRLRRHAPRVRHRRRARAPALRLLRAGTALPLHRAGAGARTPSCASTSSRWATPSSSRSRASSSTCPTCCVNCGVPALADEVKGRMDEVHAAMTEVRALMLRAQEPVG